MIWIFYCKLLYDSRPIRELYCTCPFVYQTLKLKQYSLYRLIVHSNKIHLSFEQINLTQDYRQNTSLTHSWKHDCIKVT